MEREIDGVKLKKQDCFVIVGKYSKLTLIMWKRDRNKPQQQQQQQRYNEIVSLILYDCGYL